MLKVFVGVLMIVAGVTASELCREPIHRVCRDDNSPKRFPETAEEFKNFCDFALGFFRCGVKYREKCDPEELDEPRTYLTAFEDICNEDSLLYTAITANLQCFTDVRKSSAFEECDKLSVSPSIETLHKYAEALMEEGYTVFTDDESQVNHTLICITNLQEMACYATTLEDNCGTIALEAFVETAQKFSTVGFCGETYHYLPTVIRVYKLETEEANDMAEVFKKRK